MFPPYFLTASIMPLHLVFNEGDDLLSGRAWLKNLTYPRLFEKGDIIVGDDPSAHDQDIISPFFAQQLDHFGKELVVGAGKAAEPHDVDPFLNGGGSDLFRSLADACIDNLHSRIPQGTGDYLCPAIVPIQAWFGDQNPDLPLSHGATSSR